MAMKKENAMNLVAAIGEGTASVKGMPAEVWAWLFWLGQFDSKGGNGIEVKAVAEYDTMKASTYKNYNYKSDFMIFDNLKGNRGTWRWSCLRGYILKTTKQYLENETDDLDDLYFQTMNPYEFLEETAKQLDKEKNFKDDDKRVICDKRSMKWIVERMVRNRRREDLKFLKRHICNEVIRLTLWTSPM